MNYSPTQRMPQATEKILHKKNTLVKEDEDELDYLHLMRLHPFKRKETE